MENLDKWKILLNRGFHVLTVEISLYIFIIAMLTVMLSVGNLNKISIEIAVLNDSCVHTQFAAAYVS